MQEMKGSLIQPMGSQTSTASPKFPFYAWPRELGKRKNFVGAKTNRLSGYLFVRFVDGCSILIARNQYQSIPFCSERIVLLANATQLD